MNIRYKFLFSLIAVLSCLVAKADNPTVSRDSLIDIATDVSLWFGPDFDVTKSATAKVSAPQTFSTSDGRPEVQENDGRTYYEVRFVPSDTTGYNQPFLSKVYLWDDGTPVEVLYSNGFGRDFFVDSYSALKANNVDVAIPMTNFYYRLPEKPEPTLYKDVKPNDVEGIMVGTRRALAILDDLYVNSYGIKDSDMVTNLLTAPHEKIDFSQLSSFRKVRSIQLHDGIFIYPYFSCRFTPTAGKWYFRKTTGSQRKSGYIYENSPESMVFLGGWTVNNDPLTTYDSDNGVAGTLYQLSANCLIMLFVDPDRDNSFEIYEFKR